MRVTYPSHGGLMNPDWPYQSHTDLRTTFEKAKAHREALANGTAPIDPPKVRQPGLFWPFRSHAVSAPRQRGFVDPDMGVLYLCVALGVLVWGSDYLGLGLFAL